MSPSRWPTNCLRWVLRVVLGLIGMTATSGLIWGLLASLGDGVGATAFQWITVGSAAATLVGSVALSILSAMLLISGNDESHSE